MQIIYIQGVEKRLRGEALKVGNRRLAQAISIPLIFTRGTSLWSLEIRLKIQ